LIDRLAGLQDFFDKKPSEHGESPLKIYIYHLDFAGFLDFHPAK